MTVTVAQAKSKILNALGELYRIERHSPGMISEQRQAVKESIDALEDEYLTLIKAEHAANNPSAPISYKTVAGSLGKRRDALLVVRDERKKLENAFVSAAKILGSFTPLLKLV